VGVGRAGGFAASGQRYRHFSGLRRDKDRDCRRHGAATAGQFLPGQKRNSTSAPRGCQARRAESRPRAPPPGCQAPRRNGTPNPAVRSQPEAERPSARLWDATVAHTQPEWRWVRAGRPLPFKAPKGARIRRYRPRDTGRFKDKGEVAGAVSTFEGGDRFPLPADSAHLSRTTRTEACRSRPSKATSILPSATQEDPPGSNPEGLTIRAHSFSPTSPGSVASFL